MLDAHSTFIANKAQRADNILPVSVIVAVAKCAENPASCLFRAVMVCIKYALYITIRLINLCIFCVEVVVALQVRGLQTECQSLPNQMHDGSKFAPIISPTASRIFNKVVGLYTQKPGCISNATFFPP